MPRRVQMTRARRWRARLRKFWCNWFHGGGHVRRDVFGRISWRCAKCGRWSDYPVPTAEERAVIAAMIAISEQSVANEGGGK